MKGAGKMRQIIALGGGGFSMEPDNPLLDLYILKQSGKPSPNICFLPTASGDAENYINKFYQFFRRFPCRPSHLSLFRPPTRDLEGFLLEKDIIYVGGGNTRNLLILWKEWGLVPVLKKAWEEGIVLAGISAGAICWFEEGVTDSFGEELEPIAGLGFLKGSHCPHYDGEPEWRPAYHKLIRTGAISGGLAADDGAASHFVDREVKAIVSSRPKAKAYRVHWDQKKKQVTEEELPTKFLGAQPSSP